MANQREVAAIYASLRLQTAQFKAALTEATGEMRKFSSQTRAEMREAKGAMALLGEEIGVSLPRHARGWVAALPGVSKAMTAAFDAIVVISLAESIIEAGKKLYEFRKNLEETAEKNKRAWEDTAGSIELSNAQLELANTKLENATAKLKHKPENKLKETLFETRVEAEKLTKELNDTARKVEELVKGQNRGFFGNLFAVKFGNGYEQTMAAEHVRRLGGQKTPEGQLQELDSFRASALTRLGELLEKQKRDSNPGVWNDEIASATGMVEYAGAEADRIRLSIQNKQDRAGSANAEEAQAAVKARLTALQNRLHDEQIINGESVAYEYDYWKQYVNAFQRGTDEWRTVNDNFIAARAKLLTQYTSKGALKPELDEYQKTQLEPVFVQAGRDNEMRLLDEQLRARQADAGARADKALQSTQIDLATGAITRNQAALQTAAIHAGEYREQIAALVDQLQYLHSQEYQDDMAAVLGIKDPQILERETDVQRQLTQVSGKREVTSMADQQAVRLTTVTGAVADSLGQLRVAFADSATQIAATVTRTITSINDELANGVTGQGMNFGHVFQQAAHDLAKTGIEKVESLFFGKSFAKRDGSSEDSALWVEMVGGGAGSSTDSLLKSINSGGLIDSGDDAEGGTSSAVLAALKGGGRGSSGLGGLSGLLSHSIFGMLNDSNFFGSLFGGRLFGAGGVFGHFANGGDFPAFAPIDVGEVGPERISFPVPGHVTPSNQLGGHGGAFYQITVNGGDPELNRVNFQRALAQVHGSATHNAVAVQREQQARRPRGRAY